MSFMTNYYKIKKVKLSDNKFILDNNILSQEQKTNDLIKQGFTYSSSVLIKEI